MRQLIKLPRLATFKRHELLIDDCRCRYAVNERYAIGRQSRHAVLRGKNSDKVERVNRRDHDDIRLRRLSILAFWRTGTLARPHGQRSLLLNIDLCRRLIL